MTAMASVLLVDDRPENLTALAALLGDLSLDLVHAQSGNEALRLSLKAEFALVLLDVQMPDMDGFETAELLRANPKTRRLPIIFVTAGMKDNHYRFKGYEAGAVDYLMKPIEPRELRSKVRVFCDLFLQRKELERHEELLETLVEQRTIALRESEASYRTLVESASDYVMRYDRRGVHLFANAKALAFTGLTLDQYVGKTHRELGFPQHLCEQWEAAIERVFATGEPTTLAFDIASPEGPAHLELKLSPEKDILGQVRSVVGMTRDFTERHRMEEVRQFLAQASWVATEEPFFEALARYLATCLGMDYVCIDRLEGAAKSAQTLAIFFDCQFEPNVSYTLQDTPCGDVVRKRVCCFPQGVRHLFPADQALQDMVAESYVGTTLWSSQGEAIGLIAVIGRRPLANPALAEKVLELVAIRAAGELERKLAEEALRASEERFQLAMEATRDGIWDWNIATGEVYFSPSYTRMLGYEPGEFRGRIESWMDLIFPEDRVRVLATTQECIEGLRPGFEMEYRVKTRDGDLKWILGRGKAVLRDDRGRALRLTGTHVDITERKLTDEALRKSKDRYAATLSAIDDGLWDWHIPSGKAFFSPTYYRMLGYEDEAFPASYDSWRGLVHPDDLERVEQGLQRSTDSGKGFDLDLRMKMASGQWRWVATRGKTVELDARGKALRMVGTLVDITERKQAEEERRKLEERMSQIQKLEALGVLVAGVAHNINNVLAAIMATASLRERLAGEGKDLEAFRLIGTACRRGRDVVKSLTHFAQPTLTNHGPLELHALITEVRVLLENTLRNRITIQEVFAGEPLWVLGDVGSLNHALVNLCLNALDAMPEGGTLTLRTAIPEPEWIEVSIEDSGVGMSPEVLARVLEPFFTTKEVGKGTGLGLSMTHGVLKALGGTLDLTSTPGAGTTVKLRIPRIPTPVLEISSETAPPPQRPLTVLLVDDDEDVRFLVTRMLKAAGLQVKSVGGGAAALESLAGAVPDLVILDQNMPGMNGTQTMERIRVLHPELLILVSSGQPDIEDWACFKHPNVAVIPKPFEMDEILAKLAQLSPKSAPTA